MEAVLVKIVRLPLFDEEVGKGFSEKDTKPLSKDTLFQFWTPDPDYQWSKAADGYKDKERDLNIKKPEEETHLKKD